MKTAKATDFDILPLFDVTAVGEESTATGEMVYIR